MRRLSATLSDIVTWRIDSWYESALDVLLSAPPFLELELFEFNLLCDPLPEEEARKIMMDILPQCYGRGILELNIRPGEYKILRSCLEILLIVCREEVKSC